MKFLYHILDGDTFQAKRNPPDEFLGVCSENCRMPTIAIKASPSDYPPDHHEGENLYTCSRCHHTYTGWDFVSVLHEGDTVDVFFCNETVEASE